LTKKSHSFQNGHFKTSTITFPQKQLKTFSVSLRLDTKTKIKTMLL